MAEPTTPGAASGDDVDQLLKLPIFQSLSGSFLKLNRDAIWRRPFRAGDVVCREGEFGSTAFYILDGTVDVFLSSPIKHVQQQTAAAGWFTKVRSLLADRVQHPRAEETVRRWIPIDAPVDLPYDNPIAQLTAGELFGEMTCLNLQPRSATVRAATDCTLVEMRRNVLDFLQKNKTFRAQMDEIYRRRALENHLRSVPVLASLPPEFIERLRARIELVRHAPGDVICRQGDPADAFYLVRMGFVKVSERHPGGDLVLAYIGRGGYFGEMGLLANAARNATCTALDHVEVVRMPADEFRAMVDEYPGVRVELEGVARARAEEGRMRRTTSDSVALAEFLSQGLMQAQSLLVLDLEKCTRCDDCVRACADTHDGVTRLVREGLRFDKYLVATSCRQCRDPVCMVGCPVGSIRRRNSLEVVIEDWCVGCGICSRNCPYGNITMHAFEVQAPDPKEPARMIATTQKKATGCDLCMDQSEPSCVYACPHDAAHRVEPLTFFAPSLGVAPPLAGAGARRQAGVDATSK